MSERRVPMARSIPYACEAAVLDGMARCKRTVKPCPDHPGKSPKAPKPEAIWLNMPLYPMLDAVLEQLGVWLNIVDVQTAERIRQARREHAKQIGVSVESRRTGPEEDSGCKVFGEGGVPQGSIAGLLSELLRAGFEPVIFYREQKAGKKNNRLKVFLTADGFEPWEGYIATILAGRQPGRGKVLPTELLDHFGSVVYNYVHVFANPCDEFGHVVHSVNPAGFGRGEAEFRVAYHDGLWAVKPL